MELTGKVALIIGATGKIGRAITTALSDAGANVIIHYNRSKETADELAQQIRSTGKQADIVQADLSQQQNIERMFASIADKTSHLDILVNAAGGILRTPIDNLSFKQWDELMNVNARGPAMCINHAARLMPEGSVIINITDISAQRGWGDYAVYCASKAALEAFTKSAARALAGRNIRVNAIAPGLVSFPSDFPEDRKKRILSSIPLKRPARVEEIAASVVFLAKHDYITGQVLRIDGGWYME